MMNHGPHVAWALCALLACHADADADTDSDDASPASGKADSIGPDDRTTVSQSTDPRALTWAASTALLSARPLDEIVPTLQERFDLCDDQPFLDAPFMGHCTGFLVTPSLLATAGHCLDQQPCERTRIVFGVNDVEGNAPPDVDAADVFACVDVHRSTVADVALIELDRDTLRPSLPLGSAYDGQPVGLVGHGLGSIATVDLSGVASEVTIEALRTTLDTFSGHSGSPVITLDTGEVVGVHTHGGGYSVIQRFESDCHEFARCDGEDCSATAASTSTLPFADAGLPCPLAMCE